MKILPVVFEEREMRRVYDEKTETWFFSVVDIIQVLIQQPDFQAARNYWKVLKNRLRKEGSESVTRCNRLKLPAADGKEYLTDVASAETLLRLVQSVPSPKAEPIKLWLAKVGYERMQEMSDPGRALDRAREIWQKHGRSEKWIQQRMTGSTNEHEWARIRNEFELFVSIREDSWTPFLLCVLASWREIIPPHFLTGGLAEHCPRTESPRVPHKPDYPPHPAARPLPWRNTRCVVRAGLPPTACLSPS
jgi:BRO family protein